MLQNKAKILFVIQQVTPGTHMDYVFAMARTLREERGLSLAVLLEKPSKGVESAAWITTQKMSFAPLRVLENLYLMLKARYAGVKVFYIHYSFLSAITAGIVTRLFGGKVYYWNAGMPWLYQRSWTEEWYQRLAYKLIHVLVTGADALVSGYCQTYGLLPEQVRVIPNWIDLNTVIIDDKERLITRQQYGISDSDTLLLFVHKVSNRKGAQHLVKVLSALSSDVHLVIAGDGPLLANLQSEAGTMGLTKRFHSLGFVDRTKVKSLYNAADIFVMPSEEEGSPHSLIEAMAYGLPSVVTAVGGVSETLGDNADLMVNYFDQDNFVAVINKLISDKSYYHLKQASLRRAVGRFSKPLVVDSFVSLLRD